MSEYKREPVLIESVSADFCTREWMVHCLRDYRIGAGNYLAIPVAGLDEAEAILQKLEMENDL
mgnify:CR=1 FL=1